MNGYEPGIGLDGAVLHIGRPVLAFGPGGRLFAGQVVEVRAGSDGALLYDVAVLATARPGAPILQAEIAPGLRLGDALNPQPNTFVFSA